jgi:hypothetical protein
MATGVFIVSDNFDEFERRLLALSAEGEEREPAGEDGAATAAGPMSPPYPSRNNDIRG